MIDTLHSNFSIKQCVTHSARFAVRETFLAKPIKTDCSARKN